MSRDETLVALLKPNNIEIRLMFTFNQLSLHSVEVHVSKRLSGKYCTRKG